MNFLCIKANITYITSPIKVNISRVCNLTYDLIPLLVDEGYLYVNIGESYSYLLVK